MKDKGDDQQNRKAQSLAAKRKVNKFGRKPQKKTKKKRMVCACVTQCGWCAAMCTSPCVFVFLFTAWCCFALRHPLPLSRPRPLLLSTNPLSWLLLRASKEPKREAVVVLSNSKDVHAVRPILIRVKLYKFVGLSRRSITGMKEVGNRLALHAARSLVSGLRQSDCDCLCLLPPLLPGPWSLGSGSPAFLCPCPLLLLCVLCVVCCFFLCLLLLVA
jgi:hypothetical protein